MKKILLNSLIYVKTLFVCIFITALTLIIVLMSTVFSESFLLENFNKSDYYSFLKGEIIEAYDTYGYASGLPAEFFDDNVVNLMWVYEDVNGWAKGCYNATKYQINKDRLSEDLEKKVYIYADEAMIEVNEESKEGVANFVAECVASYEKRIGFPLLDTIGEMSVKYKGLFIGGAVLLAALILGFSFLLMLSERSFSKMFEKLSLSFFGSGLIFIVPSSIVLLTGVIMRVGVANKSFYYFITTYFTMFFGILLIAGLVLLGFGLFFALLSTRLFGDAKKRIKE